MPIIHMGCLPSKSNDISVVPTRPSPATAREKKGHPRWCTKPHTKPLHGKEKDQTRLTHVTSCAGTNRLANPYVLLYGKN